MSRITLFAALAGVFVGCGSPSDDLPAPAEGGSWLRSDDLTLQLWVPEGAGVQPSDLTFSLTNTPEVEEFWEGSTWQITANPTFDAPIYLHLGPLTAKTKAAIARWDPERAALEFLPTQSVHEFIRSPIQQSGLYGIAHCFGGCPSPLPLTAVKRIDSTMVKLTWDPMTTEAGSFPYVQIERAHLLSQKDAREGHWETCETTNGWFSLALADRHAGVYLDDQPFAGTACYRLRSYNGRHFSTPGPGVLEGQPQ